MESRETTKLDFIKQPHVAFTIFIVALIVFFAIFTASKRVSQNVKLSNMETYDACVSLIKDDNLCKFIASNEINSTNSQVMTVTETNGPQSTTSVIEIESPSINRTTVYSGGKETDASIVIDDTVYVKDYADSSWAFFKDPSYEPADRTVSYDFTSENSIDVKELRDSYKFEAKENCGELNCFKYKITTEEGISSVTYIWFDDKDFLPRRILTADQESTTNTSFEYKEISIQPPSPTKEVKLEDIEEYLDS